MRRNTFDERQDQRAIEAAASDRTLDCQADGCPNRWSVEIDARRLCSAHMWSDVHMWPRITQEQRDYLADRARRAAEPKPPAVKLSANEKDEIMRNLKSFARSPKLEPRDWAHRLRERHQGGERLTKAQVDAYQGVTR